MKRAFYNRRGYNRMDYSQVVNPVDPLTELWDVWAETSDRHKLPDSYYHDAIQIQLLEVTEHLRLGRTAQAANEVVDIVSLAIDWLRRLGVKRDNLRALVGQRIATRYKNQTETIVQTYVDRLGQPYEQGQ